MKKYILTLLIAGFAFSCSSKKEPQGKALSQEGSVHYKFAYDFFVKGETIRALSSALEGVKVQPDNPDLRNLLGLIYFRQDKYDLAEREFKKAIELAPKLTEAYTNLGSLYYTTERYAEAEEILTQAMGNPLYLYPENIYNNLGLVQLMLGKEEEARASFEKAISLREDYYLPYLNLAKLWRDKGNNKAARPLLEKAVELCSDKLCTEPRYQLGMVLVEENELEKAVNLFEEAYEMGPSTYYGRLSKEYLIENSSESVE